MAKSFDPKAKAKRQKIIAAVGGVLLLGLLAFQVPRTMKMLHQSNASASEPAPTTVTTGVAGTPIAVPSLAGGNATSTGTSVAAGALSDPNSVSSANSGQLLAFSQFRTKDPFAQQINVQCAADSSSSDAAAACDTAGSPKPTTGSSTTPSPSPSQGGGTTGTPAPAQAPARPTTAVISVNGDSEEVKVGGQFPASDPTFVLTALTKTTAKVGIAGGSLEGKTQTVTLRKGKPLTLMNTADGTRYVLRLVSVS
jgi:hypothetical protein